ncbi:hypothetical protein DL769_004664 [Monosporascus sp. CRB-8-3]|nr:hypothetical protein DL769_004664 [Monosporascus sp. CRB-8-3]
MQDGVSVAVRYGGQSYRTTAGCMEGIKRGTPGQARNRRDDASDAGVELLRATHVDELTCVTLEARPQGDRGLAGEIGPDETAAPAGVLGDGHRVRA